jgi:hypothetical protein
VRSAENAQVTVRAVSLRDDQTAIRGPCVVVVQETQDAQIVDVAEAVLEKTNKWFEQNTEIKLDSIVHNAFSKFRLFLALGNVHR